MGMLAAVGGGGRSSIAVVRGGVSGGLGGDLSNSAIGASSGMGDTELLSIFLFIKCFRILTSYLNNMGENSTLSITRRF
ncbi:hypothetical protein C0J52_25752 [Blattella germanica]|nr:hypothetical protein C0J52_25752 [Blattella germanica]